MASTVHFNPKAKSWRYADAPAGLQDGESHVLQFHRQLPDYNETPLHSLPSLATELGLGHVLIKDESSRFGLPSFKILGASWAVFRAVVDRLGLGLPSPAAMELKELGAQARESGLRIVTCTEGNWGRAVSRMANRMGIPVVVYVPSHMPETTRDLIRGEGASVVPVEGDYDAAVEVAKKKASANKHLLVMDISWEGFEMVPQWVVEGYQTMLDESESQVAAITSGEHTEHNIVIVPVGCGSIAQAVTQHWKREGGSEAATVVAVEPMAAACLKASLEAGKMTSVTTGDSIMNGMNCGTLSKNAWPILESGVDLSVVVGELESHQAVEELGTLGIGAGPCGAATLAALRHLCQLRQLENGSEAKQLDENSVAILYCTEGPREYGIPSVPS